MAALLANDHFTLKLNQVEFSAMGGLLACQSSNWFASSVFALQADNPS